MSSERNRIERLPDSLEPQSDDNWLERLKHAQAENRTHFWGEDPSQLITRSHLDPGNFIIGNGADIYEKGIFPAVETAKQEIIFVTCFWARSQCLDELCKALIHLSERAKSSPSETSKLRVRLCFSSRSVVQKLFHTHNPNGYVYKPTEWVSKLGLPAPEALDWLDLEIKSLFFLPFSVMHPKFVIIDRKFALLPSCNLSYESWFEGCLPLTGPVVDRLVSFWKETWGQNDLPSSVSEISHAEQISSALASSHTISLLPSPHHRSPHFCPFLSIPPPPKTPLNVYLDDLIAEAKSSIKILTPNLTCQHVISLLLAALGRGVDVTIITNRRMMVVEQLLTAGTVTELCVRGLKKRYSKLISARESTNSTDLHVELGHSATIGTLSIGYFRPDTKYVKSHLKCTIVDEQTIVLGSGNMDRASWYTSQELGVAVEGTDVVKEIWAQVQREMARGDSDEDLGGDWVEWV